MRSRRSNAYDEGYDAFDNGVDADACPHSFDSRESADWWNGYQMAMYESYDAYRGQLEDYRLDDPRHGQGS